MNGSSVVKFNHSTLLSGPTITAGPFGTGTLRFDNTSNNTLEPVGGNQTLANPITLNFGMTFKNDTGDTSGLTLTGPISFLTTGRTLQFNLTNPTVGTPNDFL